MEEKLRRPQQTAQERRQSQTENHSDERSKNISCGDTVNNSPTNHQWSGAQKRNINSSSSSGPSLVQRMPWLFRHAQSTGNQAFPENNSILVTTRNQNFPLTTDSVYANLSNVGDIEKETISQFKSVAHQHDAGYVHDDGFVSYPRGQTPYDGIFAEACSREFTSADNNPKTSQCRVCKHEFYTRSVQYHLVVHHPEVFFRHMMSPLSMRQAAQFSACCLNVLKTETIVGKRLMEKKEKKGIKKQSETAVWCTYCNSQKRHTQHFKMHLFHYHYDILEKMMKALKARCTKSKVANVTNASQHVPNPDSTNRTKLNQNMEPGQKPNVRFAYNVAGDLGKEIASSNVNGQTCSATVNMKRDMWQNLDHSSTQQYGRQGFAEKHKTNITSTVVEGASSNWLTTATSTNEGRHGSNFHYGNATASLNDQQAVPGTAPNMSGNGTIPSVPSNLSFTPFRFPNHFSQAGISSITESSNNVNMVMANQIQQYYSTTMAPDNSQYFHPPVSVDEQHQVESNHQVFASGSSQIYSVHPQGSTGVINDGVRERNVDLEIAMEFLQEENFNFITSINPSST